jgi:hypothetical protein
MNGDLDVRGASATAGLPALVIAEDDRELVYNFFAAWAAAAVSVTGRR